MKFRRNTHDRDGNYKEEFKEEKQNWFQRQVWSKYGSIVHLLDSKQGTTFQNLLQEIRLDTTNYFYGCTDMSEVDIATLPDINEVALGLVRCIEAGFIEVVEN